MSAVQIDYSVRWKLTSTPCGHILCPHHKQARTMTTRDQLSIWSRHWGKPQHTCQNSRLLGPLSNPVPYKYEAGQINHMTAAFSRKEVGLHLYETSLQSEGKKQKPLRPLTTAFHNKILCRYSDGLRALCQGWILGKDHRFFIIL
jgi:hypothetical protein